MPVDFDAVADDLLGEGGGWYSRNPESVRIKGTDKPWMFSSGARGLKQIEIPLLGKGDPKGRYTVKLYFADIDEREPGPAAIELQGETVATGVLLPRRAPLVKEFTGIEVERNLTVALQSEDSERMSIISAIEVLRED